MAQISVPTLPMTGAQLRGALLALAEGVDAAGQVGEITPAAIGAATAAQGVLADSAVQPGDLATVATTGVYADLSGAPSLGNAAGLNVGTTAGTVAAGDDARFHDAVTLGASVSDVLNITGQALSADDPGADRLLFWDDSESKLTHLTLGTNLSITGTTLDAAGGSTNLTYTASTRLLASSTGDDVTLPLFTSTEAGLAPLSGGGTINFLRADGTWASPGGFNAGAALNLTANGAASTPPLTLSGTWFTGGTTTTTKPALLIEPAGTTSTSWSTAGTGLGVNAPSGFTGNLLDLRKGGEPRFSVDTDGNLRIRGTSEVLNIVVGNDMLLRAYSSAFGEQPLFIGSTGGLSFGMGYEVILIRDANDVLAQRNGTSPQTFRPYNTYTSATNYERGKLQWASNVFNVGTEKGSAGGTARDMALQTDGTTRLTIKADGAIIVASLPTSNPAVAGQLWNDGGTVKVSAG